LKKLLPDPASVTGPDRLLVPALVVSVPYVPTGVPLASVTL
jgi:hypothetical protein